MIKAIRGKKEMKKELNFELKREIIIEDLKEAFSELKKISEENVLFRELTAIDNAIQFLVENQSYKEVS